MTKFLKDVLVLLAPHSPILIGIKVVRHQRFIHEFHLIEIAIVPARLVPRAAIPIFRSCRVLKGPQARLVGEIVLGMPGLL